MYIYVKCQINICYVMLCYVMLCYVMLCYVMLCYVMLCYVMLCYVMGQSDICRFCGKLCKSRCGLNDHERTHIDKALVTKVSSVDQT